MHSDDYTHNILFVCDWMKTRLKSKQRYLSLCKSIENLRWTNSPKIISSVLARICIAMTKRNKPTTKIRFEEIRLYFIWQKCLRTPFTFVPYIIILLPSCLILKFTHNTRVSVPYNVCLTVRNHRFRQKCVSCRQRSNFSLSNWIHFMI